MKNLNFANNDELSVEETSTVVNVYGSNFKATFTKRRGTLTSYIYDDIQMINKTLQFNVFRLPTDNDVCLSNNKCFCKLIDNDASGYRDIHRVFGAQLRYL